MKNKTKNFKEYLKQEELLNPPAIVRRAENPTVQILRDALKYVEQAKDYLLKIVSSVSVNEVSSNFAWNMIERFIENDQFNDYLKAKFGNIRPTSKSGSYDYACGMDSCAFFYTKDYVVKFIGGNYADREFAIANAVKGQLSIVPIVDAFEAELQTEGYIQQVVVMKRLQTGFYDIPQSVTKAANAISGVIYNLQEIVERNPDLTVEYVRKRLTLAYILHKVGHLDENVANAVKDIMKIIRFVYDKSGMVLGADISGGRNIGMSDRTNKVMIFDYGRPSPHGRKVQQLSSEDPTAIQV